MATCSEATKLGGRYIEICKITLCIFGMTETVYLKYPTQSYTTNRHLPTPSLVGDCLSFP